MMVAFRFTEYCLYQHPIPKGATVDRDPPEVLVINIYGLRGCSMNPDALSSKDCKTSGDRDHSRV
jgi:hypothetical protein